MTPDINKLLERLRTYYGDDLACRMLLMDARHALEAMAGEVERLKEERNAAITDRFDAAADRIKVVAAERDRLKAALRKKLSAKARQELGDLSESMIAMGDGHSLEILLNWYDESRKALGGDA